MNDVFTSWRVIYVTTCLAVAMGLGAGWLGAVAFSAGKQAAFPQMLAQLIASENVNLRADQRQQVDALTQRYLAQRKLSGQQMHAALIQLSESMLDENALGPRSEAAAGTINEIAHRRRIESILYIMGARKLLDEEQRRNFDKNFLRAVAADSSDRDN